MYLYNEEALEQELRKLISVGSKHLYRNKKEIIEAIRPIVRLSEKELLKKTRAELDIYLEDIRAILFDRQSELQKPWQPVIDFKNQKTVQTLQKMGYHAELNDEDGSVCTWDFPDGINIWYMPFYPWAKRLNVVTPYLFIDDVFTNQFCILDVSIEMDNIQMHYEEGKTRFLEAYRDSGFTLNEKQQALLLQMDQLIDALRQIDLDTDAYADSLGLVWSRD